MVRRCPACRLALRADDPETWVQVLPGSILEMSGFPVGGYFICRDCRAIAWPDLPAILVYPPPFDGDPALNASWRFWCACCHRYAREDDPVGLSDACMRILQEDVDEYPYLRPQPRPGALRMCRDCWAVWGPVVHARWVRDGIIRADVPLEALGYNVV